MSYKLFNHKSNGIDSFLFGYTIFVILIASQLMTGAEGQDAIKPRRGGGGTVGLFAFPRVGRSDPNLSTMNSDGSSDTDSWDRNEVFPYSVEDYEIIPQDEIKRHSLVAFPRVGRAGENLKYWMKYASPKQMNKRGGGAGANGAMWFGPRLGRIQKRSTNSNDRL